MKYFLIAISALALGQLSMAIPLKECTKHHIAVDSDTCRTLSEKYNVPISSLVEWNDGLGTAEHPCLKLEVGRDYCVDHNSIKRRNNNPWDYYNYGYNHYGYNNYRHNNRHRHNGGHGYGYGYGPHGYRGHGY
ncbi:hypothetical protein BDF14DRAFT_1856053 [Spinellus fusiger]|nr:hypothetical protein BDF14DRAFT_1856053 [Spinellus fusiger]